MTNPSPTLASCEACQPASNTAAWTTPTNRTIIDEGSSAGPDYGEVIDNDYHLVWTRYENPGLPNSFTWAGASNYCTSLGMGLPTAGDASNIANDTCAWPGTWNIWTSTQYGSPDYYTTVDNTGNENGYPPSDTLYNIGALCNRAQ